MATAQQVLNAYLSIVHNPRQPAPGYYYQGNPPPMTNSAPGGWNDMLGAPLENPTTTVNSYTGPLSEQISTNKVFVLCYEMALRLTRFRTITMQHQDQFGTVLAAAAYPLATKAMVDFDCPNLPDPNDIENVTNAQITNFMNQLAARVANGQALAAAGTTGVNQMIATCCHSSCHSSCHGARGRR